MREQSGYRKKTIVQVMRYTSDCENATRLVNNNEEKAPIGDRRQPVCLQIRLCAALVCNSRVKNHAMDKKS
jgi:hypothetical protein